MLHAAVQNDCSQKHATISKYGSRSEQANSQQANEQLQSTQAELRGEKDRLKLLLDLNNSMVSKLELRDLLRVISASVRRVMQCDSVGVNLPDPETGELKLYALDFPAAKGFLREGACCVRLARLPARVFSTGQPSTFSLGNGLLPNPEADVKLYEEPKACNLRVGCP